MAARHHGPLLVYGPRSTSYDFGPHHPLTPRRFGPGIDLLRAVGAEPGLEPEPASDDELEWVHTIAYVETVRRFSDDPHRWSDRGIGPGDTPAFHDMHEAAAAVAGGSIRAMEAILRGDVEHAHHPGGGLHHAMPGRASGFCIYDDPALAIARARQDGLRVLYVDLDVHHGDGVQAIHAADPGVMTVSFHESGETLFPGTGFLDELGSGAAAGTSINLPFEAYSGDASWSPAVTRLVPWLAATFGPELIVSQHGADAHAWDPLAHLHLTTRAMSQAAQTIDAVAHRWAGGRWLATGGGGYDAYRVVPRVWALTWLAGAHVDPDLPTPSDWRDRWVDEATRYGQSPLPERLLDPPEVGARSHGGSDPDAVSIRTLERAWSTVVPRLLRAASERGWWSPVVGDASSPGARGGWSADPTAAGRPTILAEVDPAALDRLALAPRVIPPVDPDAAHRLLAAALGTPGVTLSAAVDGTSIVGLVLSAAPVDGLTGREILAVGVAPGARQAGLGTALLRAHLETAAGRSETQVEAHVSVAERDPFDPDPIEERIEVARRLFEGVGMRPVPVDPVLGRIDPATAAYRMGSGEA